MFLAHRCGSQSSCGSGTHARQSSAYCLQEWGTISWQTEGLIWLVWGKDFKALNTKHIHMYVLRVLNYACGSFQVISLQLFRVICCSSYRLIYLPSWRISNIHEKHLIWSLLILEQTHKALINTRILLDWIKLRWNCQSIFHTTKMYFLCISYKHVALTHINHA